MDDQRGAGNRYRLGAGPVFADHDAEILEDLIVAAHADAKGKIETIMAEKTKEMTAGLPIPPGMKLPF